VYGYYTYKTIILVQQDFIISTILKKRTVHFIASFTAREHYQNLNSLHFLIIVVVLLPIYIHLHPFCNKSALYMLQDITELTLTMSQIMENL
jgi:hypothetical protein